jgi:chromosome segregation ATPase
MRCLAIAVFASANAAQMNPIRRVVTLMQNMVKKIEEEAERDDELFAKFKCFCDKNAEQTSQAISDGKAKIAQLESDIPEADNQRTQTVTELHQHKEERAAANQAMEAGTSQRNKENKAFSDESADLKQNIGAMNQAIPAIESGMTGLLQVPSASTVLKALATVDMDESDKVSVRAFFQSGSSEGTPMSGEIVGILKTMKEEMEKRLDEITHNEQEAVGIFNGLIAAKNKEVGAAQEAIEEKTERAGELAVKIATLKGDLDETKSTLEQNEGYSAELTENCDKKSKDYDQIRKTRAEELVALADTIKVLNSDDALELFKKSLPASSLLQMQSTNKAIRARALSLVRGAAARYNNPRMDLIALALSGKKGGLGGITKLVDNMGESLKKEQTDDDAKLAYCKAEIEETEDKQKELKHKIEGRDAHIAADEETIDTLKSEIATVVADVKSLDKAVAEATEQRKAEHEEYIATAAQNNAALELLEFAKNRLNKFYNPKEYKEPPKEEVSEDTANSFVQVRAHGRDEPPPAFGGSSGEKSKSGGGVIGMINKIKDELKLEMNKDKLEEEDSQADYEKLMADSASKRAADLSARTEKTAALSDAEADLVDTKQRRSETQTDVDETGQYMMNLRASCDWLVENYESRKTARTEEMESLEKSKAVMSGADFSLVQTSGSLLHRRQ